MLGEERIVSPAGAGRGFDGPTAPASADRPAHASWLAGRAEPWAIATVTVVAAVLRFASLSGVSPNPFYDAAVRSMSLSLHNFFFGAIDPGGLLAIDKPPLDLWLQVVSVKLFGWGNVALRLPEALAGTASVPLLYAVVRRAAGPPSALAAAATLAVLPESVLTARSDTMDSVMMLLVILALWLTMRATRPQDRRSLVLAGVALGLAFEVKLMQALLCVPALVVLYLVARPGPLRDRALALLRAGAALVVVGLAWPVLATIAPGRHPWAIGSTDGSVWNAMFVFNGVGKLGGTSASTKPGGPGPFRLFVSTGWHYDLLFGCILLAALAVGLGGLLAARRSGSARRRRSGPLPMSAAFALALTVWIGCAIVVFDTMVTVHARYLDAVAPALAAAIGIGATALARLSRPGMRPPGVLVVVVLAAVCGYTFALRPSIAWGGVALIVAVGGALLLARGRGRVAVAGKWVTAGLVVVVVLLFPIHQSYRLVATQANDSLGTAVTSAANIAALHRYLGPRTDGVRYELAVDEPLALAPLIIEDRRPILPLSSWGGRPLVGLAELQADVASGAVRYGLVGSYRCTALTATWAACTPAARWIRSTGRNVTAQVGLRGGLRLYELTG